MANFAQLDENNTVTGVFPVDDSWNNREDELSALYGYTLKQTSYNTLRGMRVSEDRLPTWTKGFRGNYAGIGFTYDSNLDAFIPPKQEGASFNPSLYSWESNWVALPNGTYWAMIYKNASSSISSTILTELYSIPTNSLSNPNRTLLQMTGTPSGDCYAVIRDPIDRFLSAYTSNKHGVPQDSNLSDLIDWIIVQDPQALDLHFRPQTLVIKDVEKVNYFAFNRDLPALATALGLSSLPTINLSSPDSKPALTNEQISKLQAFYANDVDLYNSLIK